MPNLPSERRLHPISFLFEIASHGRQLLLPGLFVLVAGARGSETWQLWGLVFFGPYAVSAVLRSFVFRYRLEQDELVLRSGLIFRQQRHVPYRRIQNIDALQTLVHRAFGVVQVRLETAGGEEPEARLNVLSQAAFEELRGIVLGARGQSRPEAAAVPAEAPLLRLSVRELIICGLIQGRGLIVIGAAFGLLWETGLMDRITATIFGEQFSGRGVARQFLRGIFGQGVPAPSKIGITLAAFAGLLILTRIFSVGWALIRLSGFTLQRSGEDVRAEFGLLTHVAASIPIRRIQSVTIHEGPLHRLFRRVSVHVDTAGGERDEAVKLQREWLAPVIAHDGLPRLLASVLPSVDATSIEWRPVDPRGIRRARFGWIVVAGLVSLTFVLLLQWWTLVVFAALLGIGELDARRSVRALGWSLGPTAISFRSGWALRRRTIVPVAKVQAVALKESPFDRRLAMASVAVDTAGASEGGHRVAVPYVSRKTAEWLTAELSTQVSRTTFRW